MDVNPPCTNSGATPGASTPGIPGDVCARAGEVKSATKTASPEIQRIPTDDLFRLEVMTSSLFAFRDEFAPRSPRQRRLVIPAVDPLLLDQPRAAELHA